MLKKKTLIVSMAAALMATTTPAIAGDWATGEQIQKILSGNTFLGGAVNQLYAEYHDPDGTVRGEGYKGTWKVVGDAACFDYGEGETCWTAYVDGDFGIWYKDGKPGGAGMIVKGNPKNF